MQSIRRGRTSPGRRGGCENEFREKGYVAQSESGSLKGLVGQTRLRAGLADELELRVRAAGLLG